MTKTLVEIATALILAKLLGTLFIKGKQPPVLGAILAGAVLSAIIGLSKGMGLDILPGFHDPSFELLARIGIIFLLFSSGMEMQIGDIRRLGGKAFSVAWFGVLIPFFLGVAVGDFFGFTLLESLVMGAVLTATSVGIPASVLMDMDEIGTDLGQTILNAAVIDDILGIIVISLVLGTGKPMDVLGFHVAPIEYLMLGFVFFFIIIFVLARTQIDKVMGAVSKLTSPKSLASVSIAICFLISAFAGWVNLAEITGAFLAGMFIGQTLEARAIADDIRSIGQTFFIPLFFVSIGVAIDLSAIHYVSLAAVIFIGVALLGKIAGCGIGAKLSGMRSSDSVRIGIGMMPRMEVALVVVAAAMTRPSFMEGGHSNQILIMTILLVIFSTLVTPLMLKKAIEEEDY